MKSKEYQSYKIQKNYSSHGYTITDTSLPAVSNMTSIKTEKLTEQNIATKAPRNNGDLKVSNVNSSTTKKRQPSEDMVGNPDITEELTEDEIIRISKIESSQGKDETVKTVWESRVEIVLGEIISENLTVRSFTKCHRSINYLKLTLYLTYN